MSANLTKEVFEQNLNTTFWLQEQSREGAPIDLIDFKEHEAAPSYVQFSLLFRGDKSKIHEQRTYAVEHKSIGAFDMFQTPVGCNGQGIYYQAVFNRLRVEPGERLAP